MADQYITLDGTTYLLDPASSEDPPIAKRIQNPYRDDDGDYWKGRVYRSFHGGERVRRFLKESDLDEHGYYDGEGVDVSEWGQVTVQPALARSLAIQSATMPMAVASDGLSVVVGTTVDSDPPNKKYIQRYTSGTWTAIATPNASAVTDLITAPDGTMYGVQGTKLITSADSGENWSNITYGDDPADMVGVTHCAGYLYTVGPSGLEKYNGAAWEVVSNLPGTCCCTYREDVYWANHATIFRWTGEAAYQYDQLPAGFQITALIPYREVLWIMGRYEAQGADRGCVHYLMSGHEAHLVTIKETDKASDYRVSACCGGDDEVWFANCKRGGADRFDLTDGGLSSGPAWGVTGNIPFKSMAYANGYLFVGRYDNTVGTDGVYIANVMNPTTYRATGWLQTAEDDFDLPAQYKLIRSIEIAHKALAAGESIAVSYSINGGVSWTSAGTSSTLASTSSKFTLSSVRCKTLSLKFTLTAGTSQATTPTLVTPCAVVEYAPVPESSYEHNIRLAIYKTKGGDAKITALETTIGKRTVVSYTPFRGSAVNVIIADALIYQYFGDNDSATVILKLREVS